MRATVIYGTRDIRVEEVPDPAIQRAHRRRRPGHARLHLRQRPVGLPRRGRARSRASGSATSSSASSRRSAPTVSGVKRRRPRGRAVRVVRRHLRRSAARACTPPARTAASGARPAPTAARARRCGCPFADGTLVRLPAERPPTTPADRAPRAVRRHGHRPPRGPRRRGAARAPRSRWSATARSGCAACSPPTGSAPSGSSRWAATRRAPTIAKPFGATDVVAERGDAAVAARPGADRRPGRARGDRGRRHRAVDAHRDRHRPRRRRGRLRRRAARQRHRPRHRRACSTATSPCAAASRRRARTCRSCWPTCSPARSTRRRSSTCRSTSTASRPGYQAMDERTALKVLVRP